MKALIIGINYIGMKHELKGCINDATNVYTFIKDTYDVPDKNCRILTDVDIPPTKRNIIKYMKWLVKDAKPGDTLFLSYSGHGSQADDTDGSEEDGKDEVLVALDGRIRDDTIYNVMVKNLPKGVRLFCIFDCCHSATMLDLPHTYNIKKKSWLPKKSTLIKIITFNNCFKGTEKKDVVLKDCNATVITVSGCMDSQRSYETREEHKKQGVFSYYLLSILRNNSDTTYSELMQNLTSKIKKRGYRQYPKLCYGNEFESNDQVAFL